MIDFKHNAVLKPLYLTYKTAVSNRYTVGIMEFEKRIVEPGCDNCSLNTHWIKDSYNKGWFADPFIIRVEDDDFVLLVEEFKYNIRRGVISQLRIDRNDYSIKEVKTVLDTGSHLSFPAYYRKDNKLYFYPESAERGATYLYEYDESECKAREICMINPNKVADTTLVELPKNVMGGGEFQFSTTYPNYDENLLDIYSFSGTECPMVLPPVMTLKTELMTARNAGMVFNVNGKLYRPAQDCTNSYGECVEIQEMKFDGNGISLHPVNRIFSPNAVYIDAFHTFNVFENKWVAVDARRKRFPLLAKLLGK